VRGEEVMSDTLERIYVMAIRTRDGAVYINGERYVNFPKHLIVEDEKDKQECEASLQSPQSR
jgi:hypothetical protein